MTFSFEPTVSFEEEFFKLSIKIINTSQKIIHAPFYLIDKERGKIRLPHKIDHLLPEENLTSEISYRIKKEKLCSKGLYFIKKYKLCALDNKKEKIFSQEIVLNILHDKFIKIRENVQGSLPAREFKIINDKENTRKYNFDLSQAYDATFKLEWNDPTAFLNFYVYSLSLSKYNNLNSDFLSFTNFENMRVNSILRTFDQRLEGFRQNFNLPIVTAEFSENSLLTPDQYIVQIINEESNNEIDYSLTVEYIVLKDSCKQNKFNPFVGFWECTSKGGANYNFYQMTDGTLRYQIFEGNAETGFYPLFIFSLPLEESNQEYFELVSLFNGSKFTYSLNGDDSRQMSEVIYYIGNSINSFPEIFNFIKNDNPNIISFLNSTIPSTPVSLFENFFKTNFIANGTQYARDFSSNDYPGIEATTELKNKIISHGIVEEFEGNDVWPEMSVFDRSFSTNGINEPIKTYAPINLENIDVDARFLNFRDNSLTLRIPVSELEINMLVQFSGMIGNLDIGLAPELLNGLYRITNISSSSDDPGFQIITFISSRSLFAEIRFLNYPIYTEAKVNIIPQCFKITTISRDIALIGSSTRIDCSIVKLQGFSAVGGLSANQLNSRFSVYSQINNESAFLILPTGVIASETTTGGISGNLLVCTFPDNEVINNSLLQNRFTQKNTPSPSTVFFINKPILLNCWSQVEISGFVGEYSRLNGIFQAHISNFNVFDSNITPEIWKEGYYIPNRKYSCAIDVSSDGLPSFNPLTHTRNKKNFTIKRIVNKLEGSSIYSDFADACGYLVKKTGVNTHQNCSFFINLIDGNRNFTWEDLQKTLSTGKNFSVNINNRGGDPTGSFFYNFLSPFFNPSPYSTDGNILNKNAYNNIPGNPIDFSKRIDIISRKFTSQMRTIFNYVDDDQTSYIQTLISGKVLNDRVPGIDPNNENISNFLTEFEYNQNGTLINYESQKLFKDNFLNLSMQRISPSSSGFTIVNSFILSGFQKKNFSGQMILANPPDALTPLINSQDCQGRIVFVIKLANEPFINYETKYINASNAGAKAVIVIADNISTTFNFCFPVDLISEGPKNDIMYYACALSFGNQFVGFLGGDRNDPKNYQLPTTVDEKDNTNFFCNIFGFNTNSSSTGNAFLFDLQSPKMQRYTFGNSFLNDGFLQQDIEGELVLANPPDALTPLINGEDCIGKIVFIIRKPSENNSQISGKYMNAVNAGAKAVVLIANSTNSNFIYSRNVIPNGPIQNIMLYATNLAIGFDVTGYRGLDLSDENLNNPENYDLFNNSSNYRGKFLPTGPVFGDNSQRYTIIKPQFTNGKNVGYIYLPNVFTLSPLSIQLLPYMWDNYETDTVVDQFVKFWATVLTIKFNTANGIKTLSEMDSIIIDNGYNEGGFYPLILALAVFFGADRPIPEIVLPIIGTGYTPSTPLSQQANNLPTSKLTNNRFWNLPKNLECSKYQKLYPESTFKGTKVIILTSTNAVSAGDILPHIFRNSTTVNPSDLGNGLKSILIGSIDGRLQGLSARTTVGDYATKSSQLSLLPSILGTTAVLPSYNLFNESVSGLVNTATGKNLSSQLPEIKIDGLDNKGPIEASFEEEAGFLQAFGFSSTYKRDNEQYRVFNDVIGLPQPYVSTSYHHPYLEDSILAAISEDN